MKKTLLIGLIASSMLGASSAIAVGIPTIDYRAEMSQQVADSQTEFSVRTRGLLEKMLLNPTEDNACQFMSSAEKESNSKIHKLVNFALNKTRHCDLRVAESESFNDHAFDLSFGSSLKNDKASHSEQAHSSDEVLINQFQNLMKNDRFYAYNLALQSTSPAVYRALVNDAFLRLGVSQKRTNEKQTNLLKKIEHNQETLINLLSHVNNKSSRSL
ncbi:hypothetical protein [Piscirickettsia salmonis]|uniref:hypothetical protein n=1 Tax=Piscirickettsia salmonis TaxID=1238 RepID=UPI0006BCC786|nr:hypothetical protein [Piscirickettsia salmonis]ALA26631.1 hypothetical protein KW89_3p5 [Piscirickettsia salmonis]APS45844.1 hypothetical protein AVI48_15540 [Piscirickettsia salmonis]APS49273.1 hypothetical protein AVI49_16585 [Piscirickettsia salmonis]QGO82340.1 hypothetical protein Psal107_03391 [Piscirickettsia salmonis]QGP24169.1 hypothetical protein Psal158_03343 [Piscirickettsia salmonis]